MPVTTTIVMGEGLKTGLFITFLLGSETILVFYFETNEHRFETSHNYSDGVWEEKEIGGKVWLFHKTSIEKHRPRILF